MTVVVVVALVGLVALLVAVLTDSTFVAIVVIALAALGILLLLRDWRAEHRQLASDRVVPADDDEPATAQGDAEMRPEMFAPDIAAEGARRPPDAHSD
ncbi:hypothetical protein B1R94_00390 [Mycolicibacterium litorale]|nr:hypothetical protein B1R94_00390 [Mycolicibacterium litorale]